MITKSGFTYRIIFHFSKYFSTHRAVVMVANYGTTNPSPTQVFHALPPLGIAKILPWFNETCSISPVRPWLALASNRSSPKWLMQSSVKKLSSHLSFWRASNFLGEFVDLFDVNYQHSG